MKQNELAALAENATAASGLLKAMSNPNRLMILCALLDQEISVNELNAQIPLTQSSLSQHLATLRNAGLVDTRRDSQTIFYRVKGDAPLAVIKTLKKIFCP